MSGNQTVVARNNFNLNAQLVEFLQCIPNIFFRGVKEQQKAQKGKVMLVIAVVYRKRRDLSCGDTQNTETLPAQFLKPLLDLILQLSV